MGKTLHFLQLSEEFGGTKFGPFDSMEVRLGSDPTRNDITLPENLGIIAEHVKVLIQGDGSYIIAPVERTAGVYVWRGGARKPKELQSPIAVNAGDSFALVTPEGPRFFILAEMPHETDLTGDNVEGRGKQKLGAAGEGILKEIKRKGLAKVFSSKFGNFGMRAWTFIKTGQFLSPYYIVIGMTMLSGYLFAGTTSCAAFKFSRDASAARADNQDCKDELNLFKGDSTDGGDPTLIGLTEKILGAPDWKISLSDDMEFRAAYADHLNTIFHSAERYRWTYQYKLGQNNLGKFRNALKGLPEPLIRTLAYAAARPGFGGDSIYSEIKEDSEGKENCGRGPLQLTYRQARNLGLLDIQLDVYMPAAQFDDIAAREKAFQNVTYQFVNRPEIPKKGKVNQAGFQGLDDCVYYEGIDERDDLAAIASVIKSKFKELESAKKLPKQGDKYWIEARLVSLYASDFVKDYDNLKLTKQSPPSVEMKKMSIKDQRKKFAIDQAAKVAARAVAIPCLAALDKSYKDDPKKFMEPLPKLGSCAVVKTFIDFGRF
jgi:hypothetical protein